MENASRFPHPHTPPATTTDKCLTRRYTNNPLGTKDRSGQSHEASPSFDIRNRASSKLYTLDSIKYTKAGTVFWIDNDSLMGKELRSETRYYVKAEDVAPA